MIITLDLVKKININEDFYQIKLAKWSDYVFYRDAENEERIRLFFNENYLLIDMRKEGINHAKISDLFIFLLYIWFDNHPEQKAESLGRCLIEKAPHKAAAPDLVLYIGENIPQWSEGTPRKIDLTTSRIPDLVGEISDTTLAIDLDEKKSFYADLGIPEYWVIDINGQRVLAFELQPNGKYKQCFVSQILKGLQIKLLNTTLKRLNTETNISVASWFAKEIRNLLIDN